MAESKQVEVFLVDDYYTGVFFYVPADHRGNQLPPNIRRNGFHTTVPVQQLDRWRRVYEEFAAAQEEMQELINAAVEAKHSSG